MKLIKIQDKFILVSDEDAKNNEFLYNIENNTICRAMGDAEVSHFKIIAGIPSLPSIDFSDLKEEDCKRIGWVDVEKLVSEHLENNHIEASENRVKVVSELFRNSQSFNDKQFTLEEMRKAMFEAYKNGIRNPKDGKESFSELSNRVIQSLQKTEWDVEVGMEDVFTKNKENYVHHTGAKGNYSTHNKQPKITNNSIKVLRIL